MRHRERFISVPADPVELNPELCFIVSKMGSSDSRRLAATVWFLTMFFFFIYKGIRGFSRTRRPDARGWCVGAHNGAAERSETVYVHFTCCAVCVDTDKRNRSISFTSVLRLADYSLSSRACSVIPPKKVMHGPPKRRWSKILVHIYMRCKNGKIRQSEIETLPLCYCMLLFSKFKLFWGFEALMMQHR